MFKRYVAIADYLTTNRSLNLFLKETVLTYRTRNTSEADSILIAGMLQCSPCLCAVHPNSSAGSMLLQIMGTQE